MSAEVKQFMEMIAEAYAAQETVKMLNQGRDWCESCRAWTFSHDNGACSLCHKQRKEQSREE